MTAPMLRNTRRHEIAEEHRREREAKGGHVRQDTGNPNLPILVKETDKDSIMTFTGREHFVQDESIAAIACLLRHAGEFRFATDSPDYAAWTLMRLMRSRDFVWAAERADDWRKPWPGFTGTRYEAKAKRAGRVPCYLIFKRR